MDKNKSPSKQPTKPPKTIKRKRQLTEKQRKFAEGLAKDLPTNQAALLAGYSKNVANTVIYDELDNPKIIEAVQDIRERNLRLLQNAGLGTDKRFKKLAELTEAQKAIVVNNELIDVPDNTTQLNALKEAHKLAGDYPIEQIDLNHKGGVVLMTNDDPLINAYDVTPED